MTPFLHSDGETQERYNQAQMRMTVRVEQTIEIWKRRFPGLHYGLRMQPAKSCRAIVSCAIIHNLANRSNNNIEDIADGVPAANDYVPVDIEPAANTGQRARQRIADNFFTQSNDPPTHEYTCFSLLFQLGEGNTICNWSQHLFRLLRGKVTMSNRYTSQIS